MITKVGTKGLINLGKMLPAVGALVSGGLDYAETKVIAERAYRWFMKGDFSGDDEAEKDAQNTAEPIIDVEEFEEVREDAEEEQTTV